MRNEPNFSHRPSVSTWALAHFVATLQPPVWELPDARIRQLKDLTVCHKQVIGMLTMERNRLQTTLISDLQELGSLSPKQIAALVGVAPMNRDSGRLRDNRRFRGGRAQVWTMLFLATLCAV